jgi:Y_Y_Y domain/Two component regulator propeller
MWFATPGGLSSFTRAGWRTYTTADGLPSENVSTLFEDSAGTLWIGTLHGLAWFRSGRIQVPNAAQPPLHEQILGIAEEPHGALWFTTGNHVVRVFADRLQNGPVRDEDLRPFDLADGLRSVSGVRRHRSVVSDQRGSIWIATLGGLSVVQAANTNGGPPAIVHIQGLSVDGNSILLRDPVRIPGGHQRITLDYAGLSLGIPERTRFRYMLDNFDHGWSRPVAEREAAYTNLGPGKYRFRVISSNLDQVFNSAEATLAFEIEPLFWEAWWFRLLSLLLFALSVAVFIRSRMLRLTRQMNLRFEERLAERTRIAQELHDTLLQGFLSASM